MITITRSEINRMERTYCDTINGMVLSEFDVFEANHCNEDWNIIEDEEPIEATEAREEQERFEKFKQECC